jgi:hypothetical protein
VSAHEEERLSAFLDGELSARERAEVEAHLARCASCAALVARMRAVEDAARSLSAEAPAGYFDGLPARVRSRIEARRGRLPAWAWAAAAAVLLAAVTPLTLRELRSPQRTSPAAPAAAPPIAAAEKTAPAEPAAIPPGVAPAPAGGPARPASPLAKKEDAGAFAREPGATRPPRNPVAGAGEERHEASLVTPRVEPKTEAEASPVAPTEAGANAAAAPSAALPLQESAQDRMQAPARVAAAPAAVGAVASARSAELASGVADEKAGLRAAERRFEQLEAEHPRTLEEWRRLREEWRAFATAFPHSPRADEARVRTVEAGLEAWRVGGRAQDRAVLQRDIDAYLERPDAAQAARVRALLDALGH